MAVVRTKWNKFKENIRTLLQNMDMENTPINIYGKHSSVPSLKFLRVSEIHDVKTCLTLS